jgi:hypothetical protein
LTLAGIAWLSVYQTLRPRKITTNPHNLANVNIEFTEDMYPKLNIYISELTLNR